MSLFEAELVYEGYKRKEFLEKWKVQKLGYAIAIFSGRAKKNLKPNDIVDLDIYIDEFNEQIEDVDVKVEEKKEDVRDRIISNMEKYSKLVNP